MDVGFAGRKVSTVKALIDKINAAEGALVLQSLDVARKKVRDGLSTGSFDLNYALSGYPLVGFVWGRIVEIAGVEAAGKSTLALHITREAQRKGVIVAYIDAEHAFDPDYATAIGVDIKNLIFAQPDWGEQAITVARLLLEEGVRLLVVDSAAALTPKAEVEGETGDSFMGKQPRLIAQAMRQLTPLLTKHNAIAVFTNQIRMKIGMVFGNPETTPGGMALRHYASYRLMLRSPRGTAQKGKLTDGEIIETGIDTNITVIKNKLYPPYRKATFHIEYGRGIDGALDAATFLAKHYGDGKRVVLRGKSFAVGRLVETIHKDASLRAEIGKMLQAFGEEKT